MNPIGQIIIGGVAGVLVAVGWGAWISREDKDGPPGKVIVEKSAKPKTKSSFFGLPTGEDSLNPERKDAAMGKPENGMRNPVFTEILHVTGVATWGRRAVVAMSDGTVVTEQDENLIRVNRSHVVICGLPHLVEEGRCSNCRKYALKPGARSEGEWQRGAVRKGVEGVEIEKAHDAPVAEYRGEALFPPSVSMAKIGVEGQTTGGEGQGSGTPSERVRSGENPVSGHSGFGSKVSPSSHGGRGTRPRA